MKKIAIIITFIILGVLFVSCDNQTTDADPLAGVDLDKYELPQTDFLNDGHELSDYEKVLEYVITKGKFCFNDRLDGIGYQLDLKEEGGYLYCAFYCVNALKLARIGKVEVTYKTSWGSVRTSIYNELIYTKVMGVDETFSIAHRINSAMNEYFYGIYTLDRNNFSVTSSGEYELYRGNAPTDEVSEANNMKEVMVTLLTLFDGKLKANTNYNIQTLGFNLGTEDE